MHQSGTESFQCKMFRRTYFQLLLIVILIFFQNSNIKATLFIVLIIISKLENMEMQGTIDHNISFPYMQMEIERVPHPFHKVKGRILKPVLNGQPSHSFIHNFEMCKLDISFPLRSCTCYHNHCQLILTTNNITDKSILARNTVLELSFKEKEFGDQISSPLVFCSKINFDSLESS